ncbi:zinc finger protein 850-like [Megalops cyprinoides]|uniref:zinc finger protein 850-like n=1 Tax=Megalops cyprinoides TaxID=118141 RepID=UPI0018654884|nr:zinc finger protein 850-like [Megalops cyprinoides]
MALLLCKEESQECDLNPPLTYQDRCESESTDKIKQEDNEHLKDSDMEKDLEIITVQEVKKEEEEGEWEADLLDSPVELHTNNNHVNEGLHSGGRVSDSFDSGLGSTEENLMQSLIHAGAKSYQCAQCGKNFLSEDDLETHTRKKHCFKKTPARKEYCCSHCGKTFVTLIHFIVHQQIHRGDGKRERPFCCSVCGKSFYREKGLKTHQQSHKGERLHCCSKCGKSFPAKSFLMSHQRSHVRERLYHCSKCGRSFASKTNFERHKEMLYNCSQTGNNCPTEFCLNRHRQAATKKKLASGFQGLTTKKKLYSCSHCERTFTVLSNFIVHQQIHRRDGREERPFKCAQCGKSFYKEDGLKTHQQSHVGERPHCCSQCGKTFRSKTVMMSHKRTHMKEKLYHCYRCAKSFTLKSYFEKHMQIHTGEGHYNGPQCGKAFPSEYCLKRNKKNNTGKDPMVSLQQMPSKKKSYGCSHCGRTFTDLTNFIVHQQIHRGEGKEERPFCCSQCGKSFYREDGLKKHEQMHTREKEHRCCQCGKSFRTKSLLLSHHNVHAKERLYHCLKHAGSFASKGNSEEDIQMYSREKLHRCSQCGKNFSREYCLKRHKQTHAQMRSYGGLKQISTKKYCCSNCGKIFTTLTNFIVHQQIHREQGRSSDTRLQDTHPVGTKNVGRENEELEKDCEGMMKRERQRRNNSHFKTVPELGKGNHSITQPEYLQGLNHLENLNMHVDTVKRPLIPCDKVFQFYPKMIGSTADCTSAGSTAAVRDITVEDGAVRNRAVLNAYNTVSRSESAERPKNSGKIGLLPSEDELREYDLKPELKYSCEQELESQNEMNENSEHMLLRDVEEDHQPQKNVLEEMKKEEVEETDCDVSVNTIKLNNNILQFNQEIFLMERQNLSSCMKDFNIEGHSVIPQQNPVGERPYPSSQVVESFFMEKDLDTHMQRPTRENLYFQQMPTEDKTYCCSHCGRRFNTLTKYIVHLQIHRRDGKEERPFSCSQCGKSFYREEGLKTHLQAHIGERPGYSPQQRKSVRISDLTGHRQKHTAEQRYHCLQCDKSFVRQRSLLEHQESHAKLRSSSICGEVIVTDRIVKQYLTVHTGTATGFAPSANGHVTEETPVGHSHSNSFSPGPKPIMVDADVQMTCNTENMFGSKDMLRRFGKIPFILRKEQSQECVLEPMAEHHHDKDLKSLEQIKQEDNEQMLTGDDCMEEDLQLKIITVEEVKMEEGLAERDSLETTPELNKSSQYVTNRIPVAEKQIGSSTCGTSFATEGNIDTLSFHNTEETTYQYPHCGKSFIREDDLNKHQVTHTRESAYCQQIPSVTKLYSCTRCEKSFATITNYFVHLQIHRGERPFSCSQCGKSYYKEEGLKTHQLSHTGEKH